MSDTVLTKSQFLEKISHMNRDELEQVLQSHTKPAKKRRVLSLIKNVGPQREDDLK